MNDSMNFSQRFRVWLSRRGVLFLVVVLIILLTALPSWLDRPKPRIIHILGSSSRHVDVLWFKQDDISNLIATNIEGMAFTMDLARDNLIAIDIRSGTPIWKVEIPFERSGARSLLADHNTVFVVTTLSVDAYEATTGKLKWSKILGNGHVSIMSQLDSGKVRVYYGDTVFEIDSETGKMLATFPKNNIIWVSSDITLQETPAYELIATSKKTHDLLWINNRGPYLAENYYPIAFGNDKLIVSRINGICMLYLETGEYSWCHPEIDISNFAIDYQSQLGFGMRDDLVLLTIDLQTGRILGETSFLSNEPISDQNGFLSFITYSNNVLMVSFSDSRQTFGLEFK